MTVKLPRAKPDTISGFANGTAKAETGFGGIQVVTKGMQPPPKTACAECPLRRDSTPGYLGGYTPEMYLQAIFSPVSLACHCSPGFRQGVIETQKHCTGMAAVRHNFGVDKHLHPESGVRKACEEVAARFGDQITESFFATPEEFYKHHKKGQQG